MSTTYNCLTFFSTNLNDIFYENDFLDGIETLIHECIVKHFNNIHFPQLAYTNDFLQLKDQGTMVSWYLYHFEWGLLVAILSPQNGRFGLRDPYLLQPKGMCDISNQFKHIVGLLRWYQCGCSFIQVMVQLGWTSTQIGTIVKITYYFEIMQTSLEIRVSEFKSNSFGS